MGTVEKKVYKTNKKLLKRILLFFVIAIVICILYMPIVYGIKYLYYNSWKDYDLNNYNLSLSIPRAFKETEKEDPENFKINSSAFVTETEIKVNPEYVEQRPETIFSCRNILNGINLTIEYLNTEKTSKTLDEIAEGYYTLLRIYFEDKYVLGEQKNEYVNVLNTEAIKVDVDMTVEKRVKTFVTYLIPTDTREITVTFFGDSDKIDENIKMIEKIIKKIK